MQHCRLSDLRMKEVINVNTGQRLGYVCDIEFDVLTGCVTALIVPGTVKLTLFDRGEGYVVPWCSIKRVGEDIILVDCELKENTRVRERKGSWLFG